MHQILEIEIYRKLSGDIITLFVVFFPQKELEKITIYEITLKLFLFNYWIYNDSPSLFSFVTPDFLI